MLIPAAIATTACVGYWKVSSSHVFSPTMDRKMAPVAIIPTTITAAILQVVAPEGLLPVVRVEPTLRRHALNTGAEARSFMASEGVREGESNPHALSGTGS